MQTNAAAVIALGEAIKLESDGKAFYAEAAEKASDPSVKAILSALADDEKDHLRRVREIYEELKNRPGWPDSRTMIARKSGALNVFEEAGEKALASIAGDGAGNALKVALEMENKSADFYKKRAEEASCDAEKEFYKELISEEESHVLIINRLLGFLAS